MIFPHAFPLIQGSKRPAVKWSDKATHRPSNGFGPEDTYGLVTGPLNGIFVVDVDRKNGVDGLRELATYAQERGLELPDTRTVVTPSGGLHLYWAWDDATPIGNRAGVLPGVDVRGIGGFVCAGGVYRVELDGPIAAAPEWLIELVGTKAEAAPAEVATAISSEHPDWAFRVKSAERFLDSEPPCISGQGGQQQIWKVALRIMRTYELPVDEAMRLLGPYNARCVPPWDVAELQRTLVRAAEHGTGPTGMFSEGFGQKSSTVLLPSAGPWRKRRDPGHVYSFDLAQSVNGGSDKVASYSAKELAAVFAGPGAPPEWRGVWQWDVFRRRVVAVDPPFELNAETIGLTETDVARIQVWLACQGIKAALESIATAISVAASCAPFHPVQDYLDGLPEVTEDRARKYFEGLAGRLWGAPEDRNALESSHLRRLAIAAVRRMRRPGCKVDNMLILAGPQGYRKSTLCAHLFGEFFRDQMPDLASKDASIALEGYWGIEMAEMVSFSRALEAVKKEFLTRCEDKYRPVWGKTTLVIPRQCVFIGTTNEDDFLTDPTGNTRYDVCEIRQPMSLDWSRDEFWACANALEAAGESHFRDRATVDANSAKEEDRHASEDPWTDVILRYASAAKDGYVTPAQCLQYAVVIPTDRQDKQHLLRAKNILRRAFGPAKPVWVENRTQRVYVTRK